MKNPKQIVLLKQVNLKIYLQKLMCREKIFYFLYPSSFFSAAGDSVPGEDTASEPLLCSEKAGTPDASQIEAATEPYPTEVRFILKISPGIAIAAAIVIL